MNQHRQQIESLFISAIGYLEMMKKENRPASLLAVYCMIDMLSDGTPRVDAEEMYADSECKEFEVAAMKLHLNFNTEQFEKYPELVMISGNEIESVLKILNAPFYLPPSILELGPHYFEYKNNGIYKLVVVFSAYITEEFAEHKNLFGEEYTWADYFIKLMDDHKNLSFELDDSKHEISSLQTELSQANHYIKRYKEDGQIFQDVARMYRTQLEEIKKHPHSRIGDLERQIEELTKKIPTGI